MDKEKEISERIGKYQELRSGDKSVDIASLAVNELKNSGNLVSAKARKWSYAGSLLFPPLGVFIALYFFLSDEQDSNTVAWICLVLTAVIILLLWLSFSLLLSGTGVSVDQIQEINPEELKQLLQ